MPGSPKPPFTPGYDLVEVVDKLGSGANTPKVGETVASLVQFGGYSEYAYVPAEKLVPVPSSLDLSKVICLTLNYITTSKPKHDLVSSFGATPIDYRSQDLEYPSQRENRIVVRRCRL